MHGTPKTKETMVQQMHSKTCVGTLIQPVTHAKIGIRTHLGHPSQPGCTPSRSETRASHPPGNWSRAGTCPRPGSPCRAEQGRKNCKIKANTIDGTGTKHQSQTTIPRYKYQVCRVQPRLAVSRIALSTTAMSKRYDNLLRPARIRSFETKTTSLAAQHHVSAHSHT